MEIRAVCVARMEDSVSAPTHGHDERSHERPTSPCGSEISVGCEADDHDELQPSNMDMTGHNDVSKDDDNSTFTSPSTPRGAPSPGTRSPGLQDTESYTYLSNDEYFRPLKKLAMSSGASPPTALLSPVSNPTSPAHPQQIELITHIQNRVLQLRQRHEQQQQDGGERLLEQEEATVLEQQKLAGLRSFSILDILSHKPSRRKSSAPVKIVRPWDTIDDDDEDSEPPPPKSVSHGDNKTSDKGSALDALFKMTNTTLDNLNRDDKADAVNLFNNKAPPKKKRKSRTAFTNTMIFELEKRFIYQKYISPVDRDELAQGLGISNAQVITWFQNRRAKLKRDMEELKRDVEVTKVGQVISNKALLEASVNMAVLLKANKDHFRIPLSMSSFRHH